MIMISMITQIPVTYHMVCPELCGRLLALKRHIRRLNELAVKELKKNSGSVRPERETLAPAAVLCAAEAGMVDGLEMVDGEVWG
jgi:hypothetical protein